MMKQDANGTQPGKTGRAAGAGGRHRAPDGREEPAGGHAPGTNSAFLGDGAL